MSEPNENTREAGGARALSRVPTPRRERPSRAMATGFDYRPAEEVPGGVLPPDVQRRLTEQIDALNRHTRRARFTFDRDWSC